MEVKDEDNVVHKMKTADKKKSTDGKKNEVRGESNQEKEEQIMVKNKELKDQEKEIENEKNEKEEKNNMTAKKSRSEKAMDEGMELPYPVVPSNKEKDRHLARFLDIFKKMEITMPFGEALQ